MNQALDSSAHTAATTIAAMIIDDCNCAFALVRDVNAVKLASVSLVIAKVVRVSEAMLVVVIVVTNDVIGAEADARVTALVVVSVVDRTDGDKVVGLLRALDIQIPHPMSRIVRWRVSARRRVRVDGTRFDQSNAIVDLTRRGDTSAVCALEA